MFTLIITPLRENHHSTSFRYFNSRQLGPDSVGALFSVASLPEVRDIRGKPSRVAQ